MVASHTAAPIGAAKWLVRATPTPQTLPLGKGQGLLMSPTQGQAYIIGATFAPAIYFPSLARTVTVGSRCLKARLYGWLPLSDAAGIFFIAYCPHLMASGILIANGPTASSLLTVFVCFLWQVSQRLIISGKERFSSGFWKCVAACFEHVIIQLW